MSISEKFELTTTICLVRYICKIRNTDAELELLHQIFLKDLQRGEGEKR